MIRVQIDARDKLTDEVVPQYYFSAGTGWSPKFDDIVYQPCISLAPEIKFRIGQDRLPSFELEAGTLAIVRDNAFFTNAVETLNFSGAPIIIEYRADDLSGDWFRVFSGYCENAVVDHKECGILLSSPMILLQNQTITSDFGGTGDEQGTADVRGVTVPFALGNCRNVTPVCIDTPRQIYSVGEGPVSTLEVYEAGYSNGEPKADCPNFDAMITADIAPGEYVSCSALGLFRLASAPTLKLTADVQATGGSYGAMVLAILRRAGVPNGLIDLASLNALNAAFPYPFSDYLTQPVEALSYVTDALAAANAYLFVDQFSMFRVGRNTLAKSAIELREDRPDRVFSVERSSPVRPVWKVAVDHSRNFTVMSAGEISEQVRLHGEDISALIAQTEALRTDLTDTAQLAALNRDRMADFADDGILNEKEKIALFVEVRRINEEYASAIERADDYEDAPNASAITTSANDLTSAYNTLTNYLSTINYTDTSVSTVIDRQAFNAAFGNYYFAVTSLGTVLAKAANNKLIELNVDDVNKIKIGAGGSFKEYDFNADLSGVRETEDLKHYTKDEKDKLNTVEEGATAGAPEGSLIGNFPVVDVLGNIDQARTDIDNLFVSVDDANEAVVTARRTNLLSTQRDGNGTLNNNPHFLTVDGQAGAGWTVSSGHDFGVSTVSSRNGQRATLVHDDYIDMPVNISPRVLKIKFNLSRSRATAGLAGTTYYVGFHCYDAGKNFIGNQYVTSGQLHDGLSYIQPEFIVGGELKTFEGSGSFYSSFTGGWFSTVRFVRPVMYLNYDSVASTDMQSDYFYVYDVTESKAAEGHAKIADEQRVIATEKAAAAERSSEISARVGNGGAINANPSFAVKALETVNGEQVEGLEGWTRHISTGGGSVSVVPGKVSDHAARVTIAAGNSNAGGVYWRFASGGSASDRVVTAGISYTAEVDVTLMDGNMRGAGLIVRGYSQTAYLEQHIINFNSSEDFVGNWIGSYAEGSRYNYSRQITFANADVCAVQILAIGGWITIGGGENDTTVRREYDFHKVVLKPSNAGEVAGLGAEAKITTVEGVIASQSSTINLINNRSNGNLNLINDTRNRVDDLEDKAVAYFQRILEAGGSVAKLSMFAGDGVSAIDLVADYISIGSASSSKRTLELIDGSVRVNGNLSATSRIAVGSGENLWDIALRPRVFSVSDGQVISFGIDTGSVPTYDISEAGLAPLNSGEAYDLRLINITSTSATARLKISVPASTTGHSITNDYASSTGPTRQIDRGSLPESYNGEYTFNIDGSMQIWVQNYEPGAGTVRVGLYVKKSGVWQRVTIKSVFIHVPMQQGPFVTRTFNETVSGLQCGSGVTAWGAKIESYDGGSATLSALDFVSWNSAAAPASERSATPSGQKAKVTITPQ